jgi:hypothetical protein
MSDVESQVRRQILSGGEIPTHPVAGVFPLLSESDPTAFTQLVEDIIASGEVFTPIVVSATGQLLDGRNRVAAIREAKSQGKKVKFTIEVREAGQVEDWVMSLNLHRRHLSPSQRAVIGQAYVRANAVELGKDAAEREAAEALGVSRQLIRKADKLASEDPKALEKVSKGEKVLTAAPVKVAPLDKPLGAKELERAKQVMTRASMEQLMELASFLKGCLIAAKQIETGRQAQAPE